MLQSKLFSKVRKEAPSEEVSKNAKLLIKAGFIYKEMAGVYAYLPLGLRVLEKIKNIVREEMEKIGGQEIIMTALQRKDLWEKTDRWDDKNVDVWFKSKLQSGADIGFAWSHEEPITEMMKGCVASFRDLPALVFQFQIKFRNELRAKSGIMRGREFLMKDMYSYAANKEMHDKIYERAIQAYWNVFKRVGIKNDTFMTFASGGAFTQFSHEFQTITDGGEDFIYINREKNIAVNAEILNDKTLKELGVKQEELEKVETSEVGNIFSFGTGKCEQLGLFYKNSEGESAPVWLGSYGIGITRLMGVLVEKFSDDRGIIWPKSVAPFQVHLLCLDVGDKKIKSSADKIYNLLLKEGIEVLFDDRQAKTAGEKFADADLIGAPIRLVVSKKTEDAKSVEMKIRSEAKAKLVPSKSLINTLKKYAKI